VDQLLDDDRLAHARAAEEADLAALHVRGEQVDDLDAGLQDLRLRLEVTNCGAGRWIGQRSALAGMSPRSSTGSPVTLRIRPSAAAPTGTVIGLPVSSTSIPRTTPSVDDIATARTMLRPMCCCTSSVTSSASRPSCAGSRIRSAL
jgi:hypothetical protein